MAIKIIVSKYSGYCMGVKRAFAGCYRLSETYNNVCIYGEMVHNRFALNALSKKKIIFKKELNDIINDQKINNVIIRAHGIPPNQEMLLRKSDKNIFDFTCPNVKKVQLLAQKLSTDGHIIILFGKLNHPETIGISGYCKKTYYVIKDIKEAHKLPFNKIKKSALISQTTMNSIFFDEVSNFLKIKLKDLKTYNTLCHAPIKIQESAINLSKKVDGMIVVGDKMSANTTTLFEKIKKHKPCWFVETIDDLDIEGLKSFRTIGITGGSSTPQWQIESIKKHIEKKA